MAPILVVTGEWELPYFQIAADVLAYGISGARHSVHLHEPERFTAEILRFLQELGGRR